MSGIAGSPRLSSDVILEARALRKSFGRPTRSRGNASPAVDDVTFRVQRGTTYGLVGESGCGKTTVARMLVGLERPSAGDIVLDGTRMPAARTREMHRRIQMVFQDPYTSLNPRRTIGSTLMEAMVIHRIDSRHDREKRAREALERVGFAASAASRYPHEFSGGQRQRVGIARALVVQPTLLVCDEPVSALDVSIQAQILNLLQQLKRELNLSMIFISHDLGVVRHVSDTVGVMKQGRIVEEAASRRIFDKPEHPYTRALLASIPRVPTHPQISAPTHR